MAILRRTRGCAAILLVLVTWAGTARGAVKPAPGKPATAPQKPPVVQKVSALFPVRDDLRWGYIDKTGKTVLSGFEQVSDFSDGLAAVKMAGLSGFVDAMGKMIIPARYDDAGKLSEGLAQVRVGNVWGFVDKAGNTVIKAQYTWASEFHEGLSVILVGDKYGAIDKTGVTVIQPTFQDLKPMSEGLMAAKQDGKWGFVDKTGTFVISPQYDRADRFSGGLAPVWSGGKCGFIDKTGKLMIEATYDEATPFSEGVAFVGNRKREMVKDPATGRVVKIENYIAWGCIDNAGKEVIPQGIRGDGDPFSEGLSRALKDHEYGYMDKSGKVALVPQYEGQTGSFHNGLATAKIGVRYGFVDDTGKLVVAQVYTSVQPFSEGLAAVQVSPNGPFGFVDLTGRVVIKPQFQSVLGFHNGFARVRMAYKWGIIDKTGKVVFQAQFDGIGWYTDKVVAAKVKDLWGFYDWSGKAILEPQSQSANFLNDTLAVVRKGEKWGVVSAAGQLVADAQYDDCGWVFAQGLLPVCRDGKWGFVDASGKMSIEPQYDAVGGFTADGLCAVQAGGKWGFIDKAGKTAIAPQYDAAVGFSEGLAAVKVGDKWGFADKSGKSVVGPQFDSVGYFCGGLAPVLVGTKWGYADKTGKLAIPARFDKAGEFNNGIAQVRLDGRTQYINTAGKAVWAQRQYPVSAQATAKSPVTFDNGTRVIKIKVAADQIFQKRSDWEEVLRKRIQAVSDLYEKNFDIRFALTTMVPFESPEFKPGEDPKVYKGLLAGILDDMPRGDAELLIGFTGRASGLATVGFSGYYSNRVVIYDPYNGAPDMEEQVVSTMAHEICHSFGAFHVADKDSIMCAKVYIGQPQTKFDDYTIRQIKLMRDFDITSGVYSLSDDKVKLAAALFTEGHAPGDRSPLSQGHSTIGDELRWKDDYAGALREYRLVLGLDGSEPDLGHVCDLGIALLGDGQTVPGVMALRKCTTMKFEGGYSAYWHFVLGNNLAGQMDSDASFAECQGISRPALPEVCQRFVLARVSPDEAFSQFDEAIKEEPNNARYHVRYAEALLSYGRKEQSLAEYQKAAEIEPDNEAYRNAVDMVRAQIAGQ